MGVPGLWDLLRPAAARTSLSALARDAVLSNKNGLRALTIGIDASIWIYHAQVPVHGENPFLRTIFYKISSLLQQPVLPVFVFDGPDKPRHKRNQTVTRSFGTNDFKSRQFKDLLDECGLEWWNAPGEAEAELAVMNRQGKIDVVLSDDVDALLFGATCLLRNNSPTLSGSQASTSKTAARSELKTYEIYRSTAIRDLWTQREGTKLVTEDECRMAMVLVALMAGGDYVPEGLSRFGPLIAFALANAGHTELLKLYKTDRMAFEQRLPEALDEIIEELRTDRSGQVGSKQKSLAEMLSRMDPSSVFPTLALDAYLRPSTSPLSDLAEGWPGFGKGERVRNKRGKAVNDGRGDLEGMARACERFFEWGTTDLVIKKFAGESVGIFGAQVINLAREALREQGGQSNRSALPRETHSPSISSATPLPASQSTATSRITSFFPSIFPTSSSSAKAATVPVSNLGLPSSQATDENGANYIPSHIDAIHGTRVDPTHPDIIEYRVSYSHEPYSERCRNIMQGYRPNPRDLPVEKQAELGLVGRERTGAAETAHGLKPELKVWIADYLVKGAWPELIERYEQIPKMKAKAVKGRKKPVKVTPARMPVPHATEEESLAFRSFFVNKTSTQAQSQRSESQKSESGSEEEIEIVEVRRVSPLKKAISPKKTAKKRTEVSTRRRSISKSVVKTPVRKSRPKKGAISSGSEEEFETVESRSSANGARKGAVQRTSSPSSRVRRATSIPAISDLQEPLSTPERPTFAKSMSLRVADEASTLPVQSALPGLVTTTAKKSRPHPPTSSLSSLSSIESTSPNSPPPLSSSPVVVRHRKAKTTKTSISFSSLPSHASRHLSGSPSNHDRTSPLPIDPEILAQTRSPVMSSHIREMSTATLPAETGLGEPIDLCSTTDDDTPRPLRRGRPPASASPSSARTSVNKTKSVVRSPKKRTKTTTTTAATSKSRAAEGQMRLDLPVIAKPMSMSASNGVKRVTPKKKGRYVVISETESEEELDLTVRHVK